MNQKIRCTIAREDVILPKYETEGSSGMDLRAWKYVYPDTPKVEREFKNDKALFVPPYGRILFKTGLHIELPEGYEAQLRPKSGLAFKNGIMAILGTIDEDYRGDIGVTLLNTTNNRFFVLKNDRIAQMVFQKVEKFDLEVVDSLTETERGEGGFGSTGVK